MGKLTQTHLIGGLKAHLHAARTESTSLTANPRSLRTRPLKLNCRKKDKRGIKQLTLYHRWDPSGSNVGTLSSRRRDGDRRIGDVVDRYMYQVDD